MASWGPTTAGATGDHDPAHVRPANIATLGLAHGVLMCFAMSVLFPLGAILLRLLKMKHLAWFHGAVQILAWALAISGFSCGIYIAKHGGHGTFTSKNGHKQIGLVVILLMCIMPFLGAFHHFLFKKHDAPTIYGFVHRWLGRCAVIMGSVNVILGMLLGHASKERMITYSVFTGFFLSLYLCVVFYKGPEAERCKSAAASSKNSFHDTPSVRTAETTDPEKAAERGEKDVF